MLFFWKFAYPQFTGYVEYIRFSHREHLNVILSRIFFIVTYCHCYWYFVGAGEEAHPNPEHICVGDHLPCTTDAEVRGKSHTGLHGYLPIC